MIISCDSSEDNDPSAKPELRPVRLEQIDFKRELVFDDQDHLLKIISTSEFPNDVFMTSEHVFTYDDLGRPVASSTDNAWRLVYTYEGDHVVRTDEYIDDVLTQYHTFEYHPNGKLAVRLVWQDIPEEGGLIPVTKETYEYDSRNNLVKSEILYYNTGTEQHELLTRFIYSEYDDKINSEALFDNMMFNPLVKFSENNPGKMVVANKNGIVSSTDEYTYLFNDQGYAIQKTTHTTLHNGSTGSYETKYYFEEKQ